MQQKVTRSMEFEQLASKWLRRDYQALDVLARSRVDRPLTGTGCECLFAEF